MCILDYMSEGPPLPGPGHPKAEAAGQEEGDPGTVRQVLGVLTSMQSKVCG